MLPTIARVRHIIQPCTGSCGRRIISRLALALPVRFENIKMSASCVPRESIAPWIYDDV